MKRLIAFLVILCLPVYAAALEKKHIKTSEDQECSECHTNQTELWNSGKHGLMNVKCVVCHGSPENNFHAKPGIDRCRGCHGEKVADVEKKLAPRERKCTLCHELHSVKSKFRGDGGK